MSECPDIKFDWQNMERYAPRLLGETAQPKLLVESARGRAIQFELSEDVGSGRIEFLTGDAPFSLLIFDCRWAQRRVAQVSDRGWLRFNFALALDLTMSFAQGRRERIDLPSGRIINNPIDFDTEEIFDAGAVSQFVTICCQPDYLAETAGLEVDDLPFELRDDYCELSETTFYHDFALDRQETRLTADMLGCSLSGPLRLVYLLGGATALMSLALNRVLNDAEATNDPGISPADQLAITRAHDILADQFVEPPTVKQLSRAVGINRNKLYQGFKLIYGSTLADFVQNRRLEEGYRLVTEGTLPIAEVAAQVGFRHQCNFSTAMKKRYGQTPAQMRRTPQRADSSL